MKSPFYTSKQKPFIREEFKAKTPLYTEVHAADYQVTKLLLYTEPSMVFLSFTVWCATLDLRRPSGGGTISAHFISTDENII